MQIIKPILVLLHGWGFNSRVWQHLMPDLAQHYTVVAIDLPRMGVCKDGTLFLEQVIKVLLPKLPAQATYLGWSLGGMVAIRLAALFPKRVRKLILVAVMPRFLAKDFATFLVAAKKDMQTTLKIFANLQVPPGSKYRNQALELSAMLDVIDSAAEENRLMQYLYILRDVDLQQDFSNLQRQQEVHLILGDQDQIIDIGVAKKFLNVGKLSVMDGAGHAMFWTHKQQFLEILLGTA